jgi:16S rRNA (guanine527-N7)-methyltransferase
MIADSPHNLVSTRAKRELLTRHIPECEQFARILPVTGCLLDIGSGGGLPGMVIALLQPARDVHLVDSTAKKTAFLRNVADELGVTVQIHTGRAEQLSAGPLGASFDIVTARAVAPLETLVVWAAPFLRPSGRLYAIKGERWSEELATAARVLEASGLEVLGTPATDAFLGPDPERPAAPRVVMLGRRT